ncbi:protein kinase [Candidatus Woesearchaeota archaeon]|nr:protein kinase [Candidatus Woesearchaeota archaeon]
MPAYDPIAAVEQWRNISLDRQVRWLRHISGLVQKRYNGASRPLNVKVEADGISYPTVYAISTARLDVAVLPFPDTPPNTFVAKYVPRTLLGEREVVFSQRFSDSIGLRLHSASSLDRTVELAFEQAEGSLSDIIDVDELSLESTTAFAAVAYRIAEVLYAFEKAQLVHGDVKPNNIFVVQRDGASALRLGDFEWAVSYPEYTRLMKDSNVAFGTCGFYPPEFFTDKRKTLQNPTTHDMFSYGITLYALLLGSFPGERIFDNHKKDPDRAQCLHLAYLVSDVYHQEMLHVLGELEVLADLRDVILRAAHPLPQKRYQSFADVLRKLEKYI